MTKRIEAINTRPVEHNLARGFVLNGERRQIENETIFNINAELMNIQKVRINVRDTKEFR